MRSARFLLLASAAALAACSTVSNPAPSGDVATAIVPGETTRAEVEKMAGAPVQEFNPTAKRAAESVYVYRDAWGSTSELSVQYDEKGVVSSTFAEPLPRD